MTSTAQTAFLEAVRAERPAALATIVTGDATGAHLYMGASGEIVGTLGMDALDDAATPHLAEVLHLMEPARLTLETTQGAIEVFVDVTYPAPRLIVIGGVHTAIHLIALANVLGYRTVVVDNRTAFANDERFGHAAQILAVWPADALETLGLGAQDSLVFLSHDEKLDNPALAYALTTPVRYIGALGSRRTHEKRLAALRELGCSEESFTRIHAPIGLAIGARTPEEIALAILGEVVATARGRTLVSTG